MLSVGWATAASMILASCSQPIHAAAVGEARIATQLIHRRLGDCGAGRYSGAVALTKAEAEAEALAKEAAEAEALAKAEADVEDGPEPGSNSMTPCLMCEIGKASAVDGATSSDVCHWCPAGRYSFPSDEPGAVECAECPEGQALSWLLLTLSHSDFGDGTL